MNPEIVLILDRAFKFSLWCFLCAFVLFLCYASVRLRSRRKRVGDLFERSSSGAEASSTRQALQRLPINEWRLAFRVLVLSLICSLVFFLIFVFTPVPLFDNFASGDSWKVSPLRLTFLTYDRFYDGFSLEGEVWNQTDSPVIGLEAVVKIWGTDNKPLEEIRVPVEPDPLEAGNAGTFNLRYNQDSPFLEGYQLSFADRSGTTIPHVTGFDVQ